MSKAPVVVLDGVTKIHGRSNTETSVKALDNINLVIEAGEYVAITGESGSGKSTLLHLLGILDTPTSGTIEIAGQKIESLNRRERAMLRGRQVGIVFQGSNLIPSLNAFDNVLLAARYAHQITARARADTQTLLEAVGMGDRLLHLPNQLSGGQQQRVAIARALINRPSVLLADEPTGELDSKNADTVLRIFENFNQEQGQTLVIVTHNPNVWSRARRVVRLADGKIVENTVNK